jgi:hypothetical protein
MDKTKENKRFRDMRLEAFCEGSPVAIGEVYLEETGDILYQIWRVEDLSSFGERRSGLEIIAHNNKLGVAYKLETDLFLGQEDIYSKVINKWRAETRDKKIDELLK